MSFENSLHLMHIHTAFAETDFGEMLNNQVRWGRYKPATVSNERWVELLGADVNNLTHLPLTYGLTKVFVNRMREAYPDTFTEHDGIILLVASLIHDWAEAIVGDITYSKKTQVDEDEEKRQFAKNLEGFYPGDSTEIKELINESLNEVIFTPSSRLGKMFNVIERVGYVRTALRANAHLINGTAPDCEDGLRWLVADVFGHHPAILTEVARELSPIKEYLWAQQGAISAAFEMIDPSVFVNYGDEASIKQNAVAKSKQVWDAWLAA